MKKDGSPPTLVVLTDEQLDDVVSAVRYDPSCALLKLWGFITGQCPRDWPTPLWPGDYAIPFAQYDAIFRAGKPEWIVEWGLTLTDRGPSVDR